ncbi:hypothetical protein D3C77_377780 [compost metagenome]
MSAELESSASAASGAESLTTDAHGLTLSSAEPTGPELGASEASGRTLMGNRSIHEIAKPVANKRLVALSKRPPGIT